MRAAIGIELNSNTAQKAIAFLKAHQVVVDPTLALDELQTASSAKPTASFEPGVDKIARELAAQLIEVGPRTLRQRHAKSSSPKHSRWLEHCIGPG